MIINTSRNKCHSTAWWQSVLKKSGKPSCGKPSNAWEWFTLDQIMYLQVSFHKLVLTRDRSYRINLPKWIALKKTVINPKVMMKGALNRLLSQHCIMKRLLKILNAYQSYNIIKTNTTRIGLNLIPLGKITSQRCPEDIPEKRPDVFKMSPYGLTCNAKGRIRSRTSVNSTIIYKMVFYGIVDIFPDSICISSIVLPK